MPLHRSVVVEEVLGTLLLLLHLLLPYQVPPSSLEVSVLLPSLVDLPSLVEVVRFLLVLAFHLEVLVLLPSLVVAAAAVVVVEGYLVVSLLVELLLQMLEV